MTNKNNNQIKPEEGDNSNNTEKNNSLFETFANMGDNVFKGVQNLFTATEEAVPGKQQEQEARKADEERKADELNKKLEKERQEKEAKLEKEAKEAEEKAKYQAEMKAKADAEKLAKEKKQAIGKTKEAFGIIEKDGKQVPILKARKKAPESAEEANELYGWTLSLYRNWFLLSGQAKDEEAKAKAAEKKDKAEARKMAEEEAKAFGGKL